MASLGNKNWIAVVGFLLATAACTYSVTGRHNTEPAPDLPPDLVVTGLEVFQQDLSPSSLSCSPVGVALDFGAEAQRQTVGAWQRFKKKNSSITSATVHYDSLNLEMDCDVSAYGAVLSPITNTVCVTEGTLIAVLTLSDSTNRSQSVEFSGTGNATDCEATQYSMESAMRNGLGGIFSSFFP